MKGYLANWSGEVSVIKNTKNTFLWRYVISDINDKEIIGIFYKKIIANNKLKKRKKRIQKVIKRKSDKLYVKWKNYNNSFNSWTDEKEIVI